MTWLKQKKIVHTNNRIWPISASKD